MPVPHLARLSLLAALALVPVPGAALGVNDIAMISKAAERGDDASQVMLAVAYLNGDGGLEKNPAKAARWFEQAAILGNAYAQEKLGDLYEQGSGVERNATLAFDWRLKAAHRGNLRAQVKVGRMYEEGVGVEKDALKARQWIGRAAAEGDAEAQYLLGRMYHEGAGVKADAAAAKSWFEKSAMQGHEGAIYFVHLIESIGYRIEESWFQRLPDLHRLAEDGDHEAQYQLAQRYEQGAGGVKKDPAVALDWYRRAATGGHRRAMRALSHIYETGLDGVPRDPVAAQAWADKAKAAAK